MNLPTLDLNGFSGVVRLFPLPSVVLFPHAVLPLHIFEHRYRQMMADALAGDQLLAMALLQDGWETNYQGNPAIHAIASVGSILASKELPDGCYDLLLAGLERVRILEELPGPTLYRRARVEVLPRLPDPEAAIAKPLREALEQQALDYFRALNWEMAQANMLLGRHLPLGVVTDLVAFKLPLPIHYRQRLLSELDVATRCRLLLKYLQPAEPDPKSESRTFPPPFSVN